jgi:WD40 repeat protein/DNA-binding SARP family transcriptional activator
MLEIKLLGQFEVCLNGTGVALASRHSQSLLAFLALHAQQEHRREQIAGLLWPEASEANARNNLRHAIWLINQALGSNDYLRADRITLSFNTRAPHRVDAMMLLDCRPDFSATEALVEAASAYQGELLPGFYDEWMTPIREAVNIAFEKVIDALTTRLVTEKRWRDAMAWAAHWIAHAPAPEAAYRALMSACAELGDPGGLAAAYGACVDGVREHFATHPSPDTVRLYRRLRQQLEAKTAQLWLEDWGEAPDTRHHLGRDTELAQLREWVAHDQVRAVAIVGIGGVGKTTLVTVAARQLQPHFDAVVWRSLRNVPAPRALLEDWLKVLSDPSIQQADETFEQRLSQVLAELNKRRCLLVLDNFESVLATGETTGEYREGYAGYGELLRRLVQSGHRSCVLITSRERPAELAALTGNSEPVRTLRLGGVSGELGRGIMQDKGLQGADSEWEALIRAYGGNPLALKIVAEGIRGLFGGSIGRYLSDKPLVFGDVRRLFDHQFARLTRLERDILIWLAIERESTTAERLSLDLVPFATHHRILEAAQSLWERSLIETVRTGFTLQNVVMEYVTDWLVETVVRELLETQEGAISVWHTHALVKASASDYVRDAQARLIMRPVLDHLVARLSREQLAQRLTGLLEAARGGRFPRSSYVAGNVLNLMTQLGEVRRQDFSHLEIRQAYLRDARVRDCNFEGAQFRDVSFAEYFVSLNAVDLSASGSHVAIATGDEARLWHIAGGLPQPHVVLRGHDGFVWNLTFNADGQRVATASADGTVRVWDVDTGEQQLILAGHSGDVWAIAFSASGALLASGGEDQNICLWDAHTGQLLHQWHAHGSIVYSLCFAESGDLLASAGGDGTVRLWDIADTAGAVSPQCVEQFDHPGEVRALATAGETLASAGASGAIRMWDLRTRQLRLELRGHTAAVPSLALSRDGDWLASASFDRTVRLWNARQGRAILSLRAHAREARAVGLSADGTLLASVGYDGSVRLWDARAGRALWTVRGFTQEIRSVVFSPDGKHLISGSADYTVRVWDVVRQRLQRTLTGHHRWVESVAVSPDGLHIASGSYDRTVRLWDLASGQSLGTPCTQDRWVWAVAFSPNGRWMGTGGADTRVRLWDANASRLQGEFIGHERGVWCVAFSPDSVMLATASEDHTARLWRVETGECVHVLYCDASVNSVAFGRDGMLATASDDATVRLWDTRTGAVLGTLRADTLELTSLAFSADGEHLACTRGDGSVTVWDVRNRMSTRTLRGHIAPAWSVAFHPHLPLLASGSLDGTIRLWNVDTGACEATLRAERPYEHMNITGVTGLTEAEQATLIALGAVDAG